MRPVMQGRRSQTNEPNVALHSSPKHERSLNQKLDLSSRKFRARADARMLELWADEAAGVACPLHARRFHSSRQGAAGHPGKSR